MRFFSRSAIYIWDRHPPYTPQLAIELVELMQEREGGFPIKKNCPTVSRPPPLNHLQPKQQHTDHFDTVNQLSSVLPRHQFRPMWAPCPLISSLLGFPAFLIPYVAMTAAGQWCCFPFLCNFIMHIRCPGDVIVQTLQYETLPELR